MSEKRVTAYIGPVNEPSVEDAATWAEAMGERGLYPKTSARFRAAALKNLSSVLADDEPRGVAWFLENIDSIKDRWTTLNNANPSTAATYASRARTALEDFIAYRNDPSSFKGRTRSGTSASASARSAAKKTKTAEPNRPAATKANAQPTPRAEAIVGLPSRARSYPLDDGEEFHYVLPERELTVRDAMKIFYHLVTFASDFDPTNPRQARMFALVRPDTPGTDNSD